MDAMLCPDGTYVGRSGPDCQFICPAVPEVPADIKAHINDKADLIVLNVPAPNAVVMNPVVIQGQARGYWF